MAGESTTSIELLGKYREMDKQGADPQSETLNPRRVRQYLDTHGFNMENFDQRFNYNTALEIIQDKKAEGETRMYQDITAAKAILDKIGHPELMEQHIEGSFRPTLHKELTKIEQLDKENDVINGWLAYHTILKEARNRYVIEKQIQDQVKEQQVSTDKGIKEGFKEVLNDMKKHWRKMGSGEKLLGVGALILGTVAFIKSQNDTVKSIRENIWTGLKWTAGLGAGAVGVNFIWKLFAGKGPLDSFGDYTSSTAAKPTFWMDTFHTDEEKAANLQKSVVYLGDKDFVEMAEKYKEAKNCGDKRISMPTVREADMKPDQIYAALDTFYSKYGENRLVERYSKYNPRPTWREVVSIELAEDGRLDYRGNLPSRVLDDLNEYAHRSWNWLMVGEGFGVGRWLYLKAFGKNGSDTEVKSYIEKLEKESVLNETLLDSWITNKCGIKSAPHFKNAVNGSNMDASTGIKYEEVPGDSIYAVCQVSIVSVGGDKQVLGNALKSGIEKIDAFLKVRCPEVSEHLDIFKETPYVVRVASDSTLRIFVRMPVKGNPEYDRKSVRLPVDPNRDEPAGIIRNPFKSDGPGRVEGHGIDVFGSNDFISYKAFNRESDRLRFRLHFLMDESQQAEIDKICAWYTQKYNVLNMDKDKVMTAVFESEDDKNQMLKETGIIQGLRNKETLLKEIDGKFTDIEMSAAKKINGDSDAVVTAAEAMKMSKGYLWRLAVIGDTASRAQTGFDPNKKDALDNLYEDYEQVCKKYVEDKNAGRL